MDKFSEIILLVKADSIEEIAPDDLINIQPISSDEIEIAGFIGQEEIFDADVEGIEGLDLRFMQISFELNGSYYGFFYSAERDVFDKYKMVVRYMASQLKLGKVIFNDINQSSDLNEPGKPAIATDGDDFFVVSCRVSGDWPFSSDLIGRIVRNDRSTTDEFVIHSNVDEGFSNPCTTYGAVFDGLNYIVVYATKYNGNRRILAKRFSQSGEVIDHQPIDISQNENVHASLPAIAFDGNRSLVVWFEAAMIKAAFINQNAVVTNGFIIEAGLNGFQAPQIAFGDNQFMVIWNQFFLDSMRQKSMPIHGQLIDLSGNLLLPNALKIRSDNGDNPRYAQISSDGSSYLIGWIEGLLETNLRGAGSFTVYARKVSGQGVLSNGSADSVGLEVASPLIVSEISSYNSEAPKDFLNLSYEKGNYLFLWSSANYGPEAGVYGVKVSSDLTTISNVMAIPGSQYDVYVGGHLNPGQPNTVTSLKDTLVVWPSNKDLEGWYINLETSF